jgi:hypothetical protein
VCPTPVHTPAFLHAVGNGDHTCDPDDDPMVRVCVCMYLYVCICIYMCMGALFCLPSPLLRSVRLSVALCGWGGQAAPAHVRIYAFDAPTAPLSQKTFFKAEKVNLYWNRPGRALLAHDGCLEMRLWLGACMLAPCVCVCVGAVCAYVCVRRLPRDAVVVGCMYAGAVCVCVYVGAVCAYVCVSDGCLEMR